MKPKTQKVEMDGRLIMMEADLIEPISERMAEHRDDNLTDWQIKQISKFVAASEAPEETTTFGEGFRIGCAYEQEKVRLGVASESRRSFIEKHIRRLGAKITRPKKQRAIDDARSIVTKSLAYFRQHGTPENIRDFFVWLHGQGVLTRTNKWGKKFNVSESTVRAILHDRFRVFGTKGRKPK